MSYTIGGKHTYIAFALVNREQLQKLADLNASGGVKKYLVENLCDYYPLDKKSDLFEQVKSYCFSRGDDDGTFSISYETDDGCDDSELSESFVEERKEKAENEMFDDLNVDDGKCVVGIYIDDFEDYFVHNYEDAGDYLDERYITFLEPFKGNALVGDEVFFVDVARGKYNGEIISVDDNTDYAVNENNVLFFGLKTNKNGVIIPEEKTKKAKDEGWEGKMLENNMFPLEELFDSENIMSSKCTKNEDTSKGDSNSSSVQGQKGIIKKVVDKKDAAGRDHSKWSVNGEGEYNKQEIVQHTVLYVFGNLLKSMPLEKAVEYFNTTANCTKAPLVVVDNAKYPKYKETVVSDGNSNYTVYAKDWLEPDEAPVFVEKVNANFK